MNRAKSRMARVHSELDDFVSNYQEYLNNQLRALGINKRVSKVEASRIVAQNFDYSFLPKIEAKKFKRKTKVEAFFDE